MWSAVRRAAFCGALIFAAAAGTHPAAANTNTIVFEADSSSSFGVKTFTYVRTVDEDISSDATLSLQIIGDFNEDNETFSLEVDGQDLGVIFSNDGGDKCVLFNVT